MGRDITLRCPVGTAHQPYLYLLPARLGERVAVGIDGVLAELLLDAQELVVFRKRSARPGELWGFKKMPLAKLIVRLRILS